MELDWALASLHHLAFLALAAILAFELAVTARVVDAETVRRLVKVDAWYGIMAALVLAAGLARVFLGAKGPAYYVANSLFWAKMAVFAAIGGLSMLPTLQYLNWRRAARGDAHFRAPAQELASVRRMLFVEVGLFALLPILAAGMARGFGL